MGEKAVICSDSGLESGQTVIKIYEIAGRREIAEIIFGGCLLSHFKNSEELFLLEIAQDYLLVNLEDFCRKLYSFPFFSPISQ